MLKFNSYISHTAYSVINEHGEKIGTRNYSAKKYIGYNEMLFFNKIGFSTCVIDRNAFDYLAMSNIRHEDYAFLLELMRSGKKAMLLQVDLCSYRIHSHNLSKNKIKSAIWHFNVLRMQEKKSSLFAFFYTIVGRLFLLFERLCLRLKLIY